MDIVMLAVGISQYARDEIPDLTVCHEDAAQAVAAFRQLGGSFREKTLINEQATKAGIAEGIAWLAQNANPGDLAVFYYSGHGASFADDDGDEADRREEFLCPQDCGTSAGVGSFIRDDELREWLAAVSAKTRLVTIFDSCHSGSATMAPGGPIAKEVPEAVVRQIIGDAKLPQSKAAPGTIPNQIHLAGCQDFEQSFILPGAANSLFTEVLLRGLADGGITTFQDLFEYVRDGVEEEIDLAGIQQHPNLIDGTDGPLAFR